MMTASGGQQGSSGRLLVIVGGAGAGKSILTRQLVVHSAQDQVGRGGKAERLPLRVPLAELVRLIRRRREEEAAVAVPAGDGGGGWSSSSSVRVFACLLMFPMLP